MKKLHTLTEPQKVTALVAPLPLVALVASVALLAHYIDFTSAVFIVVALLFIGSIATGVVVAVVKDEHLARVVRGYRALNTECSDSARIIGELRDTNRALVANLAHARERLADGGCDLVEHDDADAYADELQKAHGETQSLVNLLRVVLDPSHDEHRVAMTDLVRFTEGGEALGMRDETIVWYADAIWNGEGYSDDDLNRLARIRENYGLTEADYPEATEKEYTETAYTASASTALYFGTLDKAYEVNGETRYPLA